MVTACDALYLLFTGGAGLVPLVAEFWLPVLLGNTVGGVVLVAVVNYAQTGQRRIPTRDSGQSKLSIREWLVGRSGRPARTGAESRVTGGESDEPR